MFVLKGQRSAGVSARRQSVPARYVRAACSLFRGIPTSAGGLGVSVLGFCAAVRRPRPLMVETIAHFERRSHDGGNLA